MAIQSQPSRISEPFAGSGTKNVIPATNATPSASQAASWASGFPPECSQPISAGGCPVPRNDMNGVLNWLSQGFAFHQDGGVWQWSALADYDTERMVRGSDGLLYWSVAQNGPGFASGPVDPTTDNGIYWSAVSTKTVSESDNSNSCATTEWCNRWFVNYITLPINLYVDATNGDDSNDGFSAATAKKTVAAVQTMIASNNSIAPSSVYVNIATGTYGETLRGVVGCSIVYKATGGVASFPSSSVYLSDGVVVTLTGSFKFGAPINVAYSGNLFLSNGCNIEFSNISSVYSVSAYGGGNIICTSGDNVSISYTGTNSFTTATINIGYSSTFINYGNITWSGTATGKRYNCIATSCIRGIGGANVIPGSSAGSVDATSYYS